MPKRKTKPRPKSARQTRIEILKRDILKKMQSASRWEHIDYWTPEKLMRYVLLEGDLNLLHMPLEYRRRLGMVRQAMQQLVAEGMVGTETVFVLSEMGRRESL